MEQEFRAPVKCCSKSCNTPFCTVSGSQILHTVFLPTAQSNSGVLSTSTDSCFRICCLVQSNSRYTIPPYFSCNSLKPCPFTSSLVNLPRYDFIDKEAWRLVSNRAPLSDVFDLYTGSNHHPDVLHCHEAALWALNVPKDNIFFQSTLPPHVIPRLGHQKRRWLLHACQTCSPYARTHLQQLSILRYHSCSLSCFQVLLTGWAVSTPRIKTLSSLNSALTCQTRGSSFVNYSSRRKVFTNSVWILCDVFAVCCTLRLTKAPKEAGFAACTFLYSWCSSWRHPRAHQRNHSEWNGAGITRFTTKDVTAINRSCIYRDSSSKSAELCSCETGSIHSGSTTPDTSTRMGMKVGFAITNVAFQTQRACFDSLEAADNRNDIMPWMMPFTWALTNFKPYSASNARL